MNILLFTNTFFPVTGGAEFVVHHLATELQKRGHHVSVLAPHLRGDMPAVPIAYPVHYYRKPVSQRIGVWMLLWPLTRAWRRQRFDILHCHNAYPPGFVAASFQRLHPSVKTVITCHGTDIMAGERLRKHSRLDARVRKAVAAADRVTAISTSMRAEILAAGALPERVVLIPNGVDLAAFQSDMPVTSPAPYIFSMGSFRPRKGFDILLRALAIALPQAPELTCRIAGDGKAAAALRALSVELNLGGRVQFLGNVHGAAKLAQLRGCEFFVCPSRWQEPFGLINLEAMAAGKTVVATAVGGIPDVVHENQNGVLVLGEDPQALAAAILKLHSDTKLRDRLARQAAVDVQAYDWPRLVDQYEALYQTLHDHTLRKARHG